jgi:hypothetical protein
MNNSSAWIRQLGPVQPVDGLDISGSAKHDALLHWFTFLPRYNYISPYKIKLRNKLFFYISSAFTLA